jgi:hypothetical protein
MSEQAPRPTAGTRARAAGTQDRDRRYAADLHAAAHANWTTRRTVVIRGQVADRYAANRHWSSRRRSRAYHLGMRPERAALWAVLLGLALVVAALLSAQM